MQRCAEQSEVFLRRGSRVQHRLRGFSVGSCLKPFWGFVPCWQGGLHDALPRQFPGIPEDDGYLKLFQFSFLPTLRIDLHMATAGAVLDDANLGGDAFRHGVGVADDTHLLALR